MVNESVATSRRPSFQLRFVIAIAIAIALSLFFVFHSSPASADVTNNVQITVVDSSGNPISGATIYSQGMYYSQLGVTDINGQVNAQVKAGTYSFEASYNFTTAWSPQFTVTTDSVTSYTFQTINAQVQLQTCSGQGLSGAHVLYKSGLYTHSFGNTDNSGVASLEMFPGSYLVTLSYAGAQTQATVDFGSTNPYTVTTAPLTLLNPGHFTYHVAGGYVYGYTGGTTVQLLPDTYIFNGNGNSFSVEVPANCSGFTGAVVRLLDHNGNGLAGGHVGYYVGGWHFDVATTDSDGNAVVSLPDSSSLSVSMTYLGTYNQQSRTQLNASNYTFRTVLATVKLENADGDPLDTGHVEYYASGWRTFGTGATSGGSVTQEMLPGSYSFAMSFNDTRQQLNGQDVANPIVFRTGELTFYFSGSSSWYQLGFHSTYRSLTTPPPIQLLPGTISVKFGVCTADLTIVSGDHLIKSAVIATLKNSANAGLAGGQASAYVGGHWVQFDEVTNSNGVACQLFDGKLGNLSVAMVYNGQRQQLPAHNQQTDSFYAFQTGNVTIELRDSANALIDTGNASYYAGGWHGLGNTSGGIIATEMLPGTYSFAMTFNGTREQLDHVAVANGSSVVFQTTGVTVHLHRSTGVMAPLSGGDASYYAGGWHTIGTTDNNGVTSVEMLPGTYSFAMVYNGTREQLNGVSISGTTTNVDFQTVLVTLMLRTPDGQSPVLDENASASYYAGGWHTTTTNNGYAPFLMLPGNYSFAMVYKGTRQQLNGVTVSGATTTVKFLTTQVHSDSATATSYYAGGWHPFTQDMYLLSGQYPFRFSDGTPQTTSTLTGGTTSHIH